MNVPDDLKYTKEHEWARIEGDTVTVGITDYAQSQLTDVVYVDLKPVGESLEAQEPFGAVEAVKAAADLYAPVPGEITEVNGALADAPETVNKDPYGEGWMVRIKAADLSAAGSLMDASAYRSLIGE